MDTLGVCYSVCVGYSGEFSSDSLSNNLYLVFASDHIKALINLVFIRLCCKINFCRKGGATDFKIVLILTIN